MGTFIKTRPSQPHGGQQKKRKGDEAEASSAPHSTA
jgi:hypothetical protein